MNEKKHDPETPEAGGWEAKAATLPAAPGVYIFKDREDKVLYVGKGKSLKARVRAYTKDGGDSRYSVTFLRPKIHDLDFIVTDTEKEALILENNLIKKYRPRYNIHLRDDKTYYHLKLTLSENFPRLVLTRRPQKGGRDLLVGPFSSSAAVKETVRTLQDIFPLRRCQSPRLRPRSRPCLNFQMGKCAGACAGKISEQDYRRMADGVAKFLKGSSDELVRELTREMAEAAGREEFERAAVLRDRIAAIRGTLERQKVDSVRPVDRDVIGFFREGGRAALHRLGYRAGALLVSESYHFARVALADEEVLGSFLAQLYSEFNPPPDEVLAAFAPTDDELLAETWSELRGKKVSLRVPARGEGRELVEMASGNARETVRREAERGEDRARAVAELQRRLRLARPPRWIEGVDIAILAGESAVGSVVKFVDGEPDKSGYRRYRIKSVEGTNDYDMMREVLSRRFSRALSEGAALPDLLLVDGGKGQLNVALAVLRELGIEDVAAAAIAKDRELSGPKEDELLKKGERVFVPGAKDPVAIKPGTAELLLLQRLRDEAHRFAGSYHRLLRGRQRKRSVLEKVPGIGPAKAKRLLKHFGGLAALKTAGVDDIAAVSGVSRADAEAVAEFFKRG